MGGYNFRIQGDYLVVIQGLTRAVEKLRDEKNEIISLQFVILRHKGTEV